MTQSLKVIASHARELCPAIKSKDENMANVISDALVDYIFGDTNGATPNELYNIRERAHLVFFDLLLGDVHDLQDLLQSPESRGRW